MRTTTKEQQEIRNAKRGDKKGVSFIALAKDTDSAQEFGKYISHLSPAGTRQVSVSVDGKKIYFTSTVRRTNTGRVCHLIQLKARSLGVVYPGWMTQAACWYRMSRGLPRLRKVNTPAARKAGKKVTRVKRTYTRKTTAVRASRVPAWKRFLRWLAK